MDILNRKPSTTHASLSTLDGEIRFLKRLVKVNSPTPNIQGVQLVQTMIDTELCKMDFETNLFRHPTREYADLLVGRKFSKKTGAKTISIVCHADTVFDSKEHPKLRFENKQMIGPGVADNKGGVTVALSGIARYLELNTDNVNLQFVCSSNEEIGSHGFTDIFAQLGKESDIVLGFEPATEDGGIINCRSGNRWYHISTSGIEAHAGRANGEEINAAHELIIKIQKILELKAKHDDLKINVANLSGGKDRYNIVCGQASVMIDIRYSKFSTRDDVHNEISKIVSQSNISSKTGQSSISTWRLDDDCPPLQRSTNDHLLENYKNAILEAESRPIETKTVGGASDVNYFSNANNFCLCGLGPVAGKIHTGDEFIVTQSLESRAIALAAFLSEN